MWWSIAIVCMCDADVALLVGQATGLLQLVLNWNFSGKSQGCVNEVRGLRQLYVCCGTTRHEAALADLQRLVPGLPTSGCSVVGWW